MSEGVATPGELTNDPLIARAVLDRVMTVETNSGRRMAGPEALEAVYPSEAQPWGDLGHPIFRRSRVGVIYGMRLARLGCTNLERALYEFGAEPLTASWHRRLSDTGRAARWLGVATLVAGARKSGWLTTLPSAHDPWIRWHVAGAANRGLRHKIYVSPPLEDLPDVLRTTLATAAALSVPAFKLAAPGRQLLRPDKLVLYCPSSTDANELLSELRSALRGSRALGVPFTEPADLAGLLSRATDPAPLRVGRAISWRMDLLERLSQAIHDAPARASDAQVLRYAGWRLRLDGVDPARWAAAR